MKNGKLMITNKCHVVNCLDYKPYDVYIGRPSKWGNPFEIGKDGTRYEVIQKYRYYIENNKDLLDSLKDLKWKTLGCFCKPEMCHGDILVELVSVLENEEILNCQNNIKESLIKIDNKINSLVIERKELIDKCGMYGHSFTKGVDDFTILGDKVLICEFCGYRET